jgi:hypothetical protein
LLQGFLVVGDARDRDDEVIGARIHEPLQPLDDGSQHANDGLPRILCVAPLPARMRRFLPGILFMQDSDAR